MRAGAPSGSASAYSDPKVIDALLKSSTPEAVAESGRSYQRLAATYEKVAGELLSMRGDLDEAWRGKDAAAAQSQLRDVWDSVAKVQETAGDFGVAVERHSEYLAWYKYNKPRSTDLTEAQSWMTGANQRISQTWSSLPAEISTSLPPAPGDGHANPATDAGLSTGGSGGATFSPAGTHSSLPTGHGGIHGTRSGGADLAGLSSGSPPSLSSGLSTGGVGGGLPPSGLGGAGRVGGLGGTGGVGSGGVIGGSGGLSGGAAQNAAAAEEAQAAEAGLASRPGILGPMLGGGAAGGRQEQERRRDHWMAEDGETWASDEATPAVIGNQAPEPEEPEPEPPVEVDLTDDDDIADLLDELNEDEPSDPAAEIAALRAKLERLERQVETDNATAGGTGWTAGEDM